MWQISFCDLQVQSKVALTCHFSLDVLILLSGRER